MTFNESDITQKIQKIKKHTIFIKKYLNKIFNL